MTHWMRSGRPAGRLFALALVTTALSPLGAHAQEKASVEERLDRLEAMLTQLMARMDGQDSRIGEQEIALVEEARRTLEDEVRQQVDAKVASAVASIEPAADSPPARMDGFTVGDTAIKISGYSKLDVMTSRFSDGIPASSSLVRDFYIPGLVPVSAGDTTTDWVSDFNYRETRFAFTTETPLGDDKITTYLEFDFQVTAGGDERVSNSNIPRIRLGYLKYKNWLFGQDWSTFQDVKALPDNLDFIGPAEGTTFERQPMIRYTHGGWELAIEQGETAFTDPNTGGRVLSGSDPLPDVIARYTHSGGWGHLRLAGILRNLNEQPNQVVGGERDDALAYGASFSGKLMVGERDDFRFMATVGEGLGRYIGVNLVNGAAVNTQGNLKPIASYSGFASYRHFWNDQLRSNLSLGYFKADNPVLFTGDGVTDEAMSMHANIIYSPVPKLEFGLEYIYAERTLENGLAGNMNRVQFSSKYAF